MLDVTEPPDKNISLKEINKLSIQKGLKMEVTKMWKLKTKTIPVEIGALGMIKKGTQKQTDEAKNTYIPKNTFNAKLSPILDTQLILSGNVSINYSSDVLKFSLPFYLYLSKQLYTYYYLFIYLRLIYNYIFIFITLFIYSYLYTYIYLKLFIDIHQYQYLFLDSFSHSTTLHLHCNINKGDVRIQFFIDFFPYRTASKPSSVRGLK